MTVRDDLETTRFVFSKTYQELLYRRTSLKFCFDDHVRDNVVLIQLDS